MLDWSTPTSGPGNSMKTHTAPRGRRARSCHVCVGRGGSLRRAHPAPRAPCAGQGSPIPCRLNAGEQRQPPLVSGDPTASWGYPAAAPRCPHPIPCRGVPGGCRSAAAAPTRGSRGALAHCSPEGPDGGQRQAPGGDGSRTPSPQPLSLSHFPTHTHTHTHGRPRLGPFSCCASL